MTYVYFLKSKLPLFSSGIHLVTPKARSAFSQRPGEEGCQNLEADLKCTALVQVLTKLSAADKSTLAKAIVKRLDLSASLEFMSLESSTGGSSLGSWLPADTDMSQHRSLQTACLAEWSEKWKLETDAATASKVKWPISFDSAIDRLMQMDSVDATSMKDVTQGFSLQSIVDLTWV